MALGIRKHLLSGNLGLIPKTAVEGEAQTSTKLFPDDTIYIHINKGLVKGGLTALHTNCTWPVIGFREANHHNVLTSKRCACLSFLIRNQTTMQGFSMSLYLFSWN